MLQYFKKLPIGVKRLCIAGTLFVPPLLGVLFEFDYSFLGNVINGYIIILPLYWLSILIGSWVYDGFNKK